MENLIIIIILAVMIGGAAAYLIKARKSGRKCIGCPAGGSCPTSQKPKKKKLAGPVIGKKTIEISGMHCEHCVANITAALNQIEGVTAEVNLSKGNAVVFYDREISGDALKSAVEKAGYKVSGIATV